MLVEDGSELVGVAPLATHIYKVGKLPVRVLALAGRVTDRLFISPSTVMVAPGRNDVLDEMLSAIRRIDWSVLSAIYMENIPAASRFIERAGSMWHPEEHASGSLLTINLPEGGDIADTFEKGARKNYYKSVKTLERDGHQAELRRVAADDLDRAVGVYVAQHIERWESKGGSYFRIPENANFLRSAFREAALRKQGFVYELLIDGEVAAQNFGFVDGDRASSYRLGMNNAFMRYSPGWMIKHMGLTDLRDSGVRKCDSGVGDEKFKQKMGGMETPLLGMRTSRGAVSLLNRVAGMAAARRKRSEREGTEAFAD